MAGALAGILSTTKSGQEVRWDLRIMRREKQQYLLSKAKEARIRPLQSHQLLLGHHRLS